jgi:hypothetical protein
VLTVKSLHAGLSGEEFRGMSGLSGEEFRGISARIKRVNVEFRRRVQSYFR